MNGFTVEEENLICIYEGQSRTEMIESMNRAVPYAEDEEMRELLSEVIKKLENMTDEQFEKAEFSQAK